MTHKAYPFEFISTVKGSDEVMEYLHTYRFTSQKSGHHYTVKFEQYPDHLYGVKFFDESAGSEVGKFSYSSGTFEPRTILQTVVNIGLDVLSKDGLASFFFLGASDPKDHSPENTRRYRVYTLFIQDIGMNNRFRHFPSKEHSLYVLINRDYVADPYAYLKPMADFLGIEMRRFPKKIPVSNAFLDGLHAYISERQKRSKE